MATKYVANWYKNGKCEGIALFSDEVPYEVLIDFVDSVWANCADDISGVDVVDTDTGEVIHDREDWDAPDNCDDDCGFDPYLGCYTDDC